MQYRMEWNQLSSFDWNRARALLVVAEAGSFTAAADALGTTQPTIGRQIAALEEELGVALVERVGRGVTLTPGGLALVEHAREMGEAARYLALVASGRSSSLRGRVTVTASEAIAVFVLPDLVAAICERYPEIELDVVASNDPSDLRRQEADIAIRNFRPTDEELVATSLPSDRGWLYGTPAYLDSIGRPGASDSLDAVRIIGWDRSPRFAELLSDFGAAFAPSNFRIASASQLFQWEMALRGHGLAVMMERVGDADPRVERALPWMQPIPVPMWLVTHRSVRTSRRVRAVFDLLRDALRAAD